MKKTDKKKLSLSRTTIRKLNDGALVGVGGGASPTFSASCDPDNCGSGGSGGSRTDYPPCLPRTQNCATQFICF